MLDLGEDPVKHHHRSLRFTEHGDRSIIANDGHVELQRRSREFKEDATARVPEFLNCLHVGSDLRQVLSVVPKASLPSGQ
jgi:hypothetical protein